MTRLAEDKKKKKTWSYLRFGSKDLIQISDINPLKQLLIKQKHTQL